MDIHVVKSFSDSCQKDVREFKNLTTICSRSFSDSCQKDVGVLRSLIGSFSDSCQKKKSSKNSSNHRYEVHPIGGELEETHHGYMYM